MAEMDFLVKALFFPLMWNSFSVTLVVKTNFSQDLTENFIYEKQSWWRSCHQFGNFWANQLSGGIKKEPFVVVFGFVLFLPYPYLFLRCLWRNGHMDLRSCFLPISNRVYADSVMPWSSYLPGFSLSFIIQLYYMLKKLEYKKFQLALS